MKYKNFSVIMLDWDKTDWRYNEELPGDVQLSVKVNEIELDESGMLPDNQREKVENLLEEMYGCKVDWFWGEGCNCQNCMEIVQVIELPDDHPLARGFDS
jgi:hypothetical protein